MTKEQDLKKMDEASYGPICKDDRKIVVT